MSWCPLKRYFRARTPYGGSDPGIQLSDEHLGLRAPVHPQNSSSLPAATPAPSCWAEEAASSALPSPSSPVLLWCGPRHLSPGSLQTSLACPLPGRSSRRSIGTFLEYRSANSLPSLKPSVAPQSPRVSLDSQDLTPTCIPSRQPRLCLCLRGTQTGLLRPCSHYLESSASFFSCPSRLCWTEAWTLLRPGPRARLQASSHHLEGLHSWTRGLTLRFCTGSRRFWSQCRAEEGKRREGGAAGPSSSEWTLGRQPHLRAPFTCLPDTSAPSALLCWGHSWPPARLTALSKPPAPAAGAISRKRHLVSGSGLWG
ncbi:uncharacterized protein [Physeter macrocephalus]|uniref:Uncharacterized protein isoform X2 n=1 Tax=Physeter macrocephalus TaxID=9755 RepID=A0A455B530_PHYMC|nr:uncharacterized protein LOC114486083 isoform X2 [Physeter catodon]XP_028344040.1 uncharacterized protein LOC114486083 isoform X2 [Physeter catodon]|eukprot:XP_028344039.1 uncharacterized protein LOC114486083 isoform X2 [Physeter catodon]